MGGLKQAANANNPQEATAQSGAARRVVMRTPDSISFHPGYARYFENGSKAGIQPHHAPKLQRQLVRLDEAKRPEDMNLPGWRLHGLAGGLAGHYSVQVNGNWRMTFAFENGDAVLVDYQD